MDIGLVAECWLYSEPFRRRQIRAMDEATQRAIDAMLNGGHPGLVRCVGHRTTNQIIHCAAYGERYDPGPVPIRRLAPLEPNAFLRWVWHNHTERAPGTIALTVEDVHWEIHQTSPDYPLEVVRKDYVRLAARVRRNQRLGLDPFEGIV